MPSFNHDRFIRAAIDSVLSQDYPDVDLLVMDGGSSDGTLDILRSYGDRLTFVSQRDKGQSDAINRGLQMLTGDVICWLNSDDLFTPGAIRRVADVFRERPDVAFVYGRGWTIDEAGQTRCDSGVLSLDVWKLIHQRNFIQQPSCFFRRSLFERVGPIDEDLFYVMDWDLWIRFAAYRGLFVDEYLSSNREYALNKTQSGQFRRWNEIARMIRRYTTRRWPPVVWIYLVEATIQKVRTMPGLKWLDPTLSPLFMQGMISELSGRYRDGTVRRTFRVSIGNPDRRRSARWRFIPLSHRDRAHLGAPAITFRWRSDSGEHGELRLVEDGRPQEFVVPLSQERLFTHFTVAADTAGVTVDADGRLPRRTVVAFLEQFEPMD
jgi:glycosyltransferase involved in cell wall biosynthesis